MIKRTLILATTLFLGAGSASAKVAPTTLETLIRFSGRIAIGTVADISTIEGVRVARVKVSQTLKGERPDFFYFLAQPTWTCDISTANIGETALFFLVPYQFGPNEFRDLMGFEEPVGFQQAVKETAGGAPFFQLAWSGRGRMPLRDVGGVQYVTIWTGDIRLPRDISTIAGPEPEHSSFIRSVRLDHVLQVIRHSTQSPDKENCFAVDARPTAWSQARFAF